VDRKYLYIGGGAVAVIAVALLAWLLWPRSAPTVAGASDSGRVQLTADDHSLGSPNAPIQVVEYAAPICPHCAHFDMDVFPQVKKAFIDTGKVHYTVRIYPISQVDIAVAGMAACLPRDQFFSFLDLMWRNQAKWDPENQVQDVHGGLVEMGRIAGLSEQRVDACIQNQEVSKQVQKQAQEAGVAYGIDGVPSFIVNGELVHSGFYPWNEIKALLDSKLKKPAPSGG